MFTRYQQDLLSNLEFHMAWVDVCKMILHTMPNSKAAPFARRMLQDEQDIIARLSRTLRVQGAPPSRARATKDIVIQARKRRTPESILRYIHQGVLASLRWYEDRLSVPEHPFHDLWADLHQQEANIRTDIENLLGIKTQGTK